MKFRTLVLGNLKNFALPLTMLGLVIGLGVALVVLSNSVGGSGEPPPIGAFVTPEPTNVSTLDVKQRDGERLTLVQQVGENSVEQTLTITPALKVERLTPIEIEDLVAGERLTIIGIPNLVKNFVVHAVIVLPADAAATDQGSPVSAGGFHGHEVAQAVDRPVLSGVIERVEGANIIFTGPTASVTIETTKNILLFRLEPGTGEDIIEGSRVAGVFGESGPASLLVVKPIRP